MRVALCQINPKVADLYGNSAKIVSFAREARDAGAEFIIMPELVSCGYSPEDLLLNKHFVKKCEKQLAFVSRDLPHDVPVILGAPHSRGDNVYNSMVCCYKKNYKYVYEKTRLPNFSVFDEKRYFKSGERIDRLGDIPEGFRMSFAPTICRDIWEDDFVERVMKETGKIDCLVNISASPYYKGKPQMVVKMLRRHARKYGVYILYCNMTGGQDEIVLFGGSVVIDPRGKVIMKAPLFTEGIYYAEIPAPAAKGKPSELNELKELNKLNKLEVNVVVKDEGVLKEIYDLIVLSIRDYFAKTGNKRALIGVSGGIDSALVAALAVDALGRENVLGVFLPTGFTTPLSRKLAIGLCKNLGIELREVEIQKLFESYLKTPSGAFDLEKTTVVEENLQSRIRGTILMAITNKDRRLLLATGNKSEIATGYATLYGDLIGAFAPIKDLYKTEVLKLAEFYNEMKKKEIISSECIKREPTAELRKGQKDSDTLPDYEILDEILKKIIEDGKSRDQVTRELPIDEITFLKVIDLLRKSEYKRRQAPIGPKISERAFGKDWRMPISTEDWTHLV